MVRGLRLALKRVALPGGTAAPGRPGGGLGFTFRSEEKIEQIVFEER